jgi:DNA-binding transcriptional ArsR family regulator
MSDAAFSALAEPRRRQILRLVGDQPQSVNAIAAELDISQQAASHHLRVLLDAGLLDVRRDAQRRVYRLRPEGLEDVRGFLDHFWPDRLAGLKRLIEDDVR